MEKIKLIHSEEILPTKRSLLKYDHTQRFENHLQPQGQRCIFRHLVNVP